MEGQKFNSTMEGEEETQTAQGRQGNVTFCPHGDIKTKLLLKGKFFEHDNEVAEHGRRGGGGDDSPGPLS